MPDDNPNPIPIHTLRELSGGSTFSPVFNPGEAQGAMRNGSRVRKIRNEAGDTHFLGDLATVLASHGPGENGHYFYFVVWDDMPGIPVGIDGRKLGLAQVQPATDRALNTALVVFGVLVLLFAVAFIWLHQP